MSIESKAQVEEFRHACNLCSLLCFKHTIGFADATSGHKFAHDEQKDYTCKPEACLFSALAQLGGKRVWAVMGLATHALQWSMAKWSVLVATGLTEAELPCSQTHI
eukprot:5186903-Amphidinium_carterae.1